MITKSNKIKTYVFLSIWGLWTMMILALSFTNGEVSSEQSNFVSEIIVRVLNLFGITLSTGMVTELNVWVRKLIGHFGLFAIDGFLSLMVFNSFWKLKPLKQGLWVMLAGFILAALSEIAQLFTPNRAGLIGDAVIDLLGFAFGLFFTMGVIQWCRVKEAKHGKRTQ